MFVYDFFKIKLLQNKKCPKDIDHRTETTFFL